MAEKSFAVEVTFKEQSDHPGCKKDSDLHPGLSANRSSLKCRKN